MKTKIVYVLTSDEGDLYLEQTLMSAYSARKHNPKANITLVTDQFTRESCKSGMRRDFLGYFDDVVVSDTSEFDSKVLRSRQLKTTLRELIKGDFLYIDSDTVVCDSLEEIDNQQGLMAAVPDSHLKKEDWPLFLEKDVEMEMFGAAVVNKHFNGGVSYVKDCPETHEFYKLWNEEWRKNLKQTGNHHDQPPLHNAIQKLGFEIDELDGTWNCQVYANFLPFLHRAKILHTFVSAVWYDCPCVFSDAALLNEIRENNGLTERIVALIDDARGAFHPINVVVGRNSVVVTRSKLMSRATFFFHEHHLLYQTLDVFSRLLILPFVLIRKIRSIYRKW